MNDHHEGVSMIREYMANDHKECDILFSQAEEAAAAGGWESVQAHIEEFAKRTLHHFRMEEEVMFPDFEETTGMSQGPTQVMRMEHAQIRRQIDELRAAAAEQNKNRFFGVAETLMILLQQHNAKEEQVLYAMADRMLDGAQVVEKMKALP
ncbi:MAG: hemerythrin domain-containing protein [Campylobacterales bacterium]